jgi:hypothetical protein
MNFHMVGSDDAKVKKIAGDLVYVVPSPSIVDLLTRSGDETLLPQMHPTTNSSPLPFPSYNPN